MTWPVFTVVASSTKILATRPPMRGETLALRCGTTYPVATRICAPCVGVTSETVLTSSCGAKSLSPKARQPNSARTTSAATMIAGVTHPGKPRRTGSRSMRKLFSSSARVGGGPAMGCRVTITRREALAASSAPRSVAETPSTSSFRRIDHRFEDGVLVAKVPIERRRTDSQRRPERQHRQSFRPLGCIDPQRCMSDLNVRHVQFLHEAKPNRGLSHVRLVPFSNRLHNLSGQYKPGDTSRVIPSGFVHQIL